MRQVICMLLVMTGCSVFSQNAIIVLHDSVKIRSELSFIRDNQLITKAGTIGLAEINYVRLQTASDVSINPTLIDQLLSAGIIVYAGTTKLSPTPPPTTPVVPPKSQPPEQPQPIKSDSKGDFSKFDIGIGLGQDYGGIGGRLTFLADQHLGIYAAGGYVLVGFGYNIGALVRIKPANRLVPTFNVMYGYNAVISISGTSQYNKIYYGPSVGVGCISKSRKDNKNYWHFELLVPFRSSQFTNDLATLKNNPAIQGVTDPLPVAISIGYHFVF